MTTRLWRGVWLADSPLDINEGAAGNTVLVLDIPEEVLAEWGWVEEGKGYREFLVPAEIVNRYGPPQFWDDHHFWPQEDSCGINR